MTRMKVMDCGRKQKDNAVTADGNATFRNFSQISQKITVRENTVLRIQQFFNEIISLREHA